MIREVIYQMMKLVATTTISTSELVLKTMAYLLESLATFWNLTHKTLRVYIADRRNEPRACTRRPHVWYVHYYLTRQLLDSNPRWVNPDVTCSRWALPCVCLHQIEEADGCIMVMVMDDASPSSAGTTHVSCVRRSQKACGHSRAEFFFFEPQPSRVEYRQYPNHNLVLLSCNSIYSALCVCLSSAGFWSGLGSIFSLHRREMLLGTTVTVYLIIQSRSQTS